MTPMTSRLPVACLGIAAVLGLACDATTRPSPGSAGPQPKESTTVDANKTGVSDAKLAKATFGGGCFWCIEAVFEQMPGVKSAVSGYAGGKAENPYYELVCTGLTGHAEVIQVEYDPAVVSFDELLDTFWKVHDPTTLNRQGPDEGTQYRSVIFYHDEAQKVAAERAIAALDAAKVFSDPVVTEVAPLPKFYPAEEKHQDYYRNNSGARYCRLMIAPKLEKLKKEKATTKS
jgi:peptide-methionine (S)-S-oxide reductase